MLGQALKIAGPEGPLSGELLRPEAAKALLVLAHGAGAGYQHANLQAIAQALFEAEIATLRFNFPFMEAGRKRVDSPRVATAAVAAALAMGSDRCPELPLFLGGHSFGGRMASHALLEHTLVPRGLVFCSFPLHQPKKPSVTRAAHLQNIELPMLFLSGTRDALAQRELLEEVLAGLSSQAQLHWLATADHSYRILKRQRQPQPTVFDEMAGVIADFVAAVLESGS